ncbi:unnamed protein product [Closterium sp. Yama58-4]|nr:unnamed protein product [Closterium sp. Yama58-4]
MKQGSYKNSLAFREFANVTGKHGRINPCEGDPKQPWNARQCGQRRSAFLCTRGLYAGLEGQFRGCAQRDVMAGGIPRRDSLPVEGTTADEGETYSEQAERRSATGGDTSGGDTGSGGTELMLKGDREEEGAWEEEVAVEDGEGSNEWFYNEDMCKWPDKLQLTPGLYLVGTPIGNLEDVTIRALRVLRCADLILAEDTRRSVKLLRFYGITTPMMSYHAFNATARRDALIGRMRAGQSLALVSDAGMPGVSDPGADLVAACAESAVPVSVIPGPSAATTAVAAAGFLTNGFTFSHFGIAQAALFQFPCLLLHCLARPVGFLPERSAVLQRQLEEAVQGEALLMGFLPERSAVRQRRLQEAAEGEAMQVLFVAPHKLLSSLSHCIHAFGPDRPCLVARELTKLHEELWRGTLSEALAEFTARGTKGEFTLVIDGLPRKDLDASQQTGEEEVTAYLEKLIQDGTPPSQAARMAAETLRVKRKQAYALALAISNRLQQAQGQTAEAEGLEEEAGSMGSGGAAQGES